MTNFSDKEYHPVIEDFVLKYVDDSLDSVERATFEEVLVHDHDLCELAFSSRSGKNLLDRFRENKTREGSLDRFLETMSSYNN